MSRMNWPDTNAELALRDSLDSVHSEKFDLAQILSRTFMELPTKHRQHLAKLAKEGGYRFERDGTLVREKPYRPVRGIEY